MVGHHGNRRSDLWDVDHRLPLDDRHRMGYLYVDDLKLGDDLHGLNLDVNRVNHNCALRDRKTDENSDESLYLRMNDLLDDHSKYGKKSHRVDLSIDPECYVLGGHRMNGTDDRSDLNLDVMMDANRDHRTNDPLVDLMTDVNHVNRKTVRRDRKMDANLVGNLCLRMNDLLDGQNLGVNLLNRNCALRDPKTDENSDVSRDLRMNDRLDGH